jgi:hypothetical protein
MSTYQSRLDRIEAAIAPKETLHLVIVKDDETQERALEAYATRRGLTAAEIRGPVIYLTETEARF